MDKNHSFKDSDSRSKKRDHHSKTAFTIMFLDCSFNLHIAIQWFLLGRSLMIGWRKKSWNPDRVPSVATMFSVIFTNSIYIHTYISKLSSCCRSSFCKHFIISYPNILCRFGLLSEVWIQFETFLSNRTICKSTILIWINSLHPYLIKPFKLIYQIIGAGKILACSAIFFINPIIAPVFCCLHT